ncbi:hypothetical protein OB959_21600 [Aeromonas bestiarum]|uniref:Restriction endonuclease type IV Mrr domain-containing protein n=1 Tax=Aeromonas bestiarum TaxID=105751 RepID=A0AAW7I3I6_9GAMM|nr:hypothetical protein [Aeromonas bestiarum]MDM5142361.1 hypothetical protein [Aeromonas bestiarum]
MGYQYQPLSSWDEFENLCLNLFRLELKDDSIHKNGRQGTIQNGVDIFGKSFLSGKLLGFQCKGKQVYPERRIKQGEIDSEIEKAKNFEPKLDCLFFLTTASRDPSIQEHIRRINESISIDFEVGVYFWNDIELMLNKYPEVAMVFYPNSKMDYLSRVDLSSHKKVCGLLPYDDFIYHIKNEIFSPYFEIDKLNPLYCFIELRNDPNVFFNNDDLSFIYRRMQIVADRMRYLIGTHSFPYNTRSGYNEFPYKDQSISQKGRDFYLATLNEVVLDAQEFYELYCEFIQYPHKKTA